VRIIREVSEDSHELPPLPISESSSRESALAFEAGISSAYLRAVPDHREALEMLGHALTRAGRHEEALEVDRRLVGLQPGNAFVRYNLACSLSNLGRVDEAFLELEAAMELGYDDLRHMAEDPDLAKVRADPRWRALVERGRKGNR
jgi:predicted Zn-dependent protease